MINPRWLELPMSRIYFHGPKNVRTIEVLLYPSSYTEESTSETPGAAGGGVK